MCCNRAERLTLLLAGLVGLLAPTLFTLTTNSIWEDYFITVRHSENLARGDGLVYNVGERVHGFTSPLGVLVPAGLHWLFQSESYIPTLTAFRALSILAIAAMLMLNVRILQKQGVSLGFQWLFIGLMGLDVKTLAFCTNGMETAFMLLFLSWALYEAQASVSNNWLRFGLAWSAFMWTRPDSCVYIALLGLGSLAFGEGTRKERFMSLLKAAGVCAVGYLPWFIWAWTYYGSPVPQTIIAKSLGNERSGEFLTFSQYLQFLLMNPISTIVQTCVTIYSPAYASFPDQNIFSKVFALVISLLGSLYWISSSSLKLARLASLTFMGLTLYLVSMRNIFPWYCPPVAMLGYLVLAIGGSSIIQEWGSLSPIKRLSLGLVGVGMLASNALLTFDSTRLMAAQQHYVEWQGRYQIGLWMKNQVKPGETIYLEPIGYIGYFSNAHISDYPGLVNRRVTDLRKQYKAQFDTLIPHLKPDWIIVRPYELDIINAIPGVKQDYQLVKTFSVMDQLQEVRDMPGWGILEFDATFHILKRKAPQE